MKTNFKVKLLMKHYYEVHLKKVYLRLHLHSIQVHLLFRNDNLIQSALASGLDYHH